MDPVGYGSAAGVEWTVHLPRLCNFKVHFHQGRLFQLPNVATSLWQTPIAPGDLPCSSIHSSPLPFTSLPVCFRKQSCSSSKP
uniref:Uncharacterized protein n=1 Tax=Anguilla anguilla TaxID=7936 RepID=A0A0E9UXV8_ANGAN